MWTRECRTLRVSDLERAARQRQEWDAMAFSPKFRWSRRQKQEEMWWNKRMEQCERWPQQACTTMFLDSEERHERPSHCAYANVDSLVGNPAGARSCEAATRISY